MSKKFKVLGLGIVMGIMAMFVVLPAIAGMDNGVGRAVAHSTGLVIVQAAADSDLVAVAASSSGIISDNKSTIMGYLVDIFTVLIVIAVSIGALYFALRKARGIFGGGRRRK